LINIGLAGVLSAQSFLDRPGIILYLRKGDDFVSHHRLDSVHHIGATDQDRGCEHRQQQKVEPEQFH